MNDKHAIHKAIKKLMDKHKNKPVRITVHYKTLHVNASNVRVFLSKGKHLEIEIAELNTTMDVSDDKLNQFLEFIDFTYEVLSPKLIEIHHNVKQF